MRVAAVIPALDEAEAIGAALAGLPRGLVERIVVSDNGSTDATASTALAAGAIVVSEPRRGYGSACLRGLAFLEKDPPDVVLFLDADGSDDPSEAVAVLAPILDGRADFVVGSRALGVAERGSMTVVQQFGNRLAGFLLRSFYGMAVTDLGPFRAIRWDSLRALDMNDRDYGWTVEMQVKAGRAGLAYVEVPVRYRRRAGLTRSKISGTVKGTILAGTKILGTIAIDLLRHGPPARPTAQRVAPRTGGQS